MSANPCAVASRRGVTKFWIDGGGREHRSGAALRVTAGGCALLRRHILMDETKMGANGVRPRPCGTKGTLTSSSAVTQASIPNVTACRHGSLHFQISYNKYCAKQIKWYIFGTPGSQLPARQHAVCISLLRLP